MSVRPDLEEARRFLSRLDPDPAARFGFATFDDAKKVKTAAGDGPDPGLILRRFGFFEHVADELARMNDAGAGVFVTVNELDGQGYSTENVRRVRAVIADLDHEDPAAAGEALERAKAGRIPPSGVLESSPGRFHLYWFTDGLDLESFHPVCEGLIARFGGDRAVKDLPRVMRLPGFVHRKDPGAPFRSRIVYVNDVRYPAAEITAEFAIARPPDRGPRFGDDATRTVTFDAAALRSALTAIPADDRETYVTVVRAVKLSAAEAGFSPEEARSIVEAWARSSSKFDATEFATRWADFKKSGARAQRLGSVFKLARDYGWQHPSTLTVDDFYAFMPAHSYLYVHTRDQWPAGSVNARVPAIGTAGGPMAPATWLDRNRPVDQVTWAPGEPMLIEGKFVADGGWVERPAARTFNLYRPPVIRPGDPNEARPWLDHVERLYPEEAEHLVRWLAHRVQRPGEKINHGVFLGGTPGIGKDTLLAPVKYAVGPWNFAEASPSAILGEWSWFVKSVVLRVSEARDLGGSELNSKNRFAFYEHLKVYAASPPETLVVNEKNLKQYLVPNVTGVIITSNHRDGLYLPPNDRRWFVCWSEVEKGDVADENRALWSWYADGGARSVAAYLADLDLGGFDPFDEPPRTSAFRAAAASGADPLVAEAADAIDALGNPDAFTVRSLLERASDELREAMRGGRRAPHLLAELDYVRIENPGDRTGKWKVDGRRDTVYARAGLSRADQLRAAYAIAMGRTEVPF